MASTGGLNQATFRGRRVTPMGDPGLFGILKDIGGGIVGGLTGLATGGPLGAIAGAAAGSGLLGGPSGGPGAGVTPAIPATAIPRPVSGPGGGGFVAGGIPGLRGPGGPNGFQLPPIIKDPFRTGREMGRVAFGPPREASEAEMVGEATATGMTGACPSCPTGFRPNKSAYFLKDGTFVPKKSRCVRSRRRNPLNPRALSRSMSRLKSAKRASRMMGRISIRDAKRC